MDEESIYYKSQYHRDSGHRLRVITMGPVGRASCLMSSILMRMSVSGLIETMLASKAYSGKSDLVTQSSCLCIRVMDGGVGQQPKPEAR